ncbi:thiamine pyrophosphate-dependent dehydrogenase E1 component subunit alpha [Paenibacillus sp. SYP-B3998]|uniref:2-oxoisovalerate dehydrogenase subunit alpha n=1 Tax=Paenibacillus sp. SYP-B3998 TaxID=2678564 RepID=A0A6G3ZVR9_9BACL|nr:thiamine pyrophosphate-dependent dehydrogenase E1 component subunit alpha [Paenibacillus sp. SYP-B3998]NEW06170.1 thiamine pyrophosphate-dependent dehydrogenase E1 component subunit alpha [Paenibacillus sp. SYP-B3998]
MSIGQLSKHRSLGLSDEEAVRMYTVMSLTAKYDERGLMLQRAGKVPFHISGMGQYAGQVGMAFALQPQKDYFLPYYRDFAFILSIGMTVKDLMLSLFCKAEDVNSGGRQMPGHFGDKKNNVVTGSSPVTTQVPHAVGIALAAKMKKEDFVTFVSFGEGSSNQGDFHEGCNFAGVHKLPVVFVCENNQYAISVPLHKQVSGKIADRAIGYGFPGYQVDGSDALEMYRVMKEARERAIRGEGPTLIEMMSYRLMPHSTSDDDMLYRTKEEVEQNRQKDGIVKFKEYLMECGLWSEEQDRELQDKQKLEVNEATKYADLAPYPKPEDTLLHVYAEGDDL